MLTVRFARERNVGACPQARARMGVFRGRKFHCHQGHVYKRRLYVQQGGRGAEKILNNFQGHLRVDVDDF